MATYQRETATILEVYQRRVFPGPEEKYIRLPWNLITHDDGNQFIEPVSLLPEGFTWYDRNNDDTDAQWLIVDVPPFQGVTEIR